MTQIEYANHVKEILEDISEKEVEVKEVQKNNVTKVALVVKDAGDNVAPTFYVENYIDRPCYEMVDVIMNFKDDNKNKIVNEAIEVINNYEEILKRVRFKIVNKNLNINSNKLYLDLDNGLIAQFFVNLDGGSITIEQDIANRFEMNPKNIFEIAKKNMVNDLSIIDMNEYLAELMDIQDNILVNLPPMYIVTSKDKYLGAGMIYLDGMKEKLNGLVGDFCVIPSSVHEVIVTSKIDYVVLRSMIDEINRTTVSQEDYLSDDVFELIEDGVLRIA